MWSEWSFSALMLLVGYQDGQLVKVLFQQSLEVLDGPSLTGKTHSRKLAN